MPLTTILLWLAAISPSDYAGASACRSCHPSQFEAQTSSAHARALARSKPPQPGEWAFGAGGQAITFVRRLDAEHYLEEGQSWYRELNGFALTPGHTTPAGVRDRIFDPSAAMLRCFGCHSTGPLRLAEDQAIVPHELGVRCETCHGPAAAHVRDPARTRPRNPGRLSADELNRLCGECHRMPVAADQASLRNPWNARHQPMMLAASNCFLKSSGRLSCLNCHSPHAPLETNLAAYDAACRKCHAAPRHRTGVAGRACAGCHMPAVRPQRYLEFANHRIAIYSPSDPMSPVSARR
jgi:hypothetical protein